MRVFNPLTSPKLVIERTNIVGRDAAVLIRGGVMESYVVTEPILVEHFSFGWQALDLLNFRCRLDKHAVSDRDKVLLMRGMPMPDDDRPCTGVGKDAGPQADVEAVRQQMRHPFVPHVIVSGTYALGDWYGRGGGEALFRKCGRGHWRLVLSGGGSMGTAEMRKYGVPQSAWCAFGIYNATCSRRR
jgi:hypothetical protein